jgi:hypothetical protein
MTWLLTMPKMKRWKMRKPYRTYEEIPLMMREYILTVAEEKSIMDISLEDINSFLDGLHAYYQTQKEEYSEGWV